MEKNEIKETIMQLSKEFLVEEVGFDLNDEDDPLVIILSDSIQAVNFITLLENEFEIEFDDDEIDLDFFTSFDMIAELIIKHLCKNYN